MVHIVLDAGDHQLHMTGWRTHVSGIGGARQKKIASAAQNDVFFCQNLVDS